MTLRELEYIVALAHHLSFVKAAEECCVSQSALSIQVRKLEDFLGVQIFERTNKSVMMTQIGEEICKQAQEILNASKALRALARAHTNPDEGNIHIGGFSTLAPYLFPKIIPDIKKTFPRLTLFLAENTTAPLADQLYRGEIDCAFLPETFLTPNLEGRLLFTENFLVALSSAHPLTAKKKLTSEDLRRENLLLLNENNCYGGEARAVCETLLNTGAIKPYQASSLETLRNMVIAGSGLTLIPEIAASTPHRGIAYRPLSGVPPRRSIYLMWRKTSSKQKFFEKIYECIMTSLSKETFAYEQQEKI